ncbi:MAG: PD-(D/E)XK nuclease family protein, partial [Vicinamibacterales bacterium]
GYRGRVWRVADAAYLALSDDRPWVSVVAGGERAPLDDARRRVTDAVRGIRRGEFPPRPVERRLCAMCAFSAVCRKDYVA